MSEPKSRSGNGDLTCPRCARVACVCATNITLPFCGATLGFDPSRGAYVMDAPTPATGPRPVSAEDAMKRANEACALAEKAAKGAEVGSLSQTHRSIIESLRHAHANAVGRIDGCEGEVRSLWEKLSAWPHPDDLEARLVALEGRRPGDVPSGAFLGDAHNRLCVAVAGIEREMQTHAGETSRTFADVSTRLVACDEANGKTRATLEGLERRLTATENAFGGLGLRSGSALAKLEQRLERVEARCAGWEDEARGARTAAGGWRRSTWLAVLACGVLVAAFAMVAVRCAVLAREADEARAMLLERRR